MKWGVPGTLSPSYLSPVGTPCLGLLSSGNRASFLGSFAILSLHTWPVDLRDLHLPLPPTWASAPQFTDEESEARSVR